MNKENKILKGCILFISITLIVSLIGYIYTDKMINEKVYFPNIYQSDALKSKIGSVKKLERSFLEIPDSENKIRLLITTENGEKYLVKINYKHPEELEVIEKRR